MDNEFFGEADLLQGPCEFCREPFPFDLLIQHESGCRPDIACFTYGEPPADDSEEEEAPIPPKEVAKDAKKPNIVRETHQKGEDFEDLVTNAKKTIGGPLKVKTNEMQKSPPVKPSGKTIIYEDPTLQQETGPNLMAYGSSKSRPPTESEKPSFKVPSLLNNADQQRESSEESKLLLSDSEDGESLEMFWKRAEIKNTQRLRALAKT